MKPPVRNFFGAAAILVVVLALGLGFWLVGSPIEARNRKLDERQVSGLTVIYSTIQRYIAVNHHAPDNMKTILKAAGTLDDAYSNAYSENFDINDVEIDRKFSYRKIDEKQLELCTDFESDTTTERIPFGDDSRFVQHKKGHVCFTLPSVGKAH